jgi:hypothetical protein
MNYCKTEEFQADLRKLLTDEAKRSREYSVRHAKEKHYEVAYKHQLEASTYEFLLREISQYAQTGRWL